MLRETGCRQAFERREMLVILKKNYEEISSEAARMVAAAVRNNPAATLGLATGATMLGVYKELVRLHKEEALDFSRVVTFNLDEYLGLAADHLESFHYFMRENFFAHVNIRPGNTHIPDGKVSGDYEKYCAAYEESIRKAGGIDLQILGIGRNGHVGFNEPTSSLASRTRLKVLNKETLEDNRKSFPPGEEIPSCAITMGIGTILEAKKIILLATGAAKAEAVAKAIEGPVTASLTASALQLHRDVTFILDEDAASELAQREYYRQVLEMTKLYTPSRLE
jgi:glucosamine-6-phosphate deaminase